MSQHSQSRSVFSLAVTHFKIGAELLNFNIKYGIKMNSAEAINIIGEMLFIYSKMTFNVCWFSNCLEAKSIWIIAPINKDENVPTVLEN
ncbi:hypothetical protein D3C86_1635340 [compost metagenome]